MVFTAIMDNRPDPSLDPCRRPHREDQMHGPPHVEVRQRPGIDRGTSKLVRTFNRSMIALLDEKLGHFENRTTKKF